MIKQNLHCHTTFDDGADTPEAMVNAAISAGLTSVGVSAHSPILGKAWCVSEENEPRFKAELRRLRERYRGQIEVYCGLEYDSRSAQRFEGYDYVIASVHALSGTTIDNTIEEARQVIEHYGSADAAACAYYAHCAQLADIAQADIVGHFDLLTKFDELHRLYDRGSKVYRDAAFAAMERLNVAGKIFEINTGAISRGYRSTPYPAPELLRHLNAIGGRITVSSDAHSAAAICCAFDKAEALAQSCGFTELWQFNGSGFDAVTI